MNAANHLRRATWPALLAVACATVAIAMPGAPHATPAQAVPPEVAMPAQAAMHAQAVSPAAAARRTPVERGIPYLRAAAGPTLDVHRPLGTDRPAAAVLVVHGGAWSGGDKAAINHVALALAAAGFVAVNVNYTLAAPGRPGFPRQLQELGAAVRWVRRNAQRLGVDPTRIGAIGSSAGAHLAALLATTTSGPLTTGDRLAAVVTWSAPVDLGRVALRGRLRSKIATFLGCARCPRRTAAASPLSHVSPDDPPMMVVNSRRELIPATQARQLARRLRLSRVPRRLRLVPGGLHAPLFSPTVLAPSISFLRRRLR